jgi:hypothetical protein
MATTTPNYGWAVPTSTDLVKDGATAIETLGDSIDASMFTALGTKKAGMVLLNTTSFSAVASQAIPVSTFSATYDFYRIICDFTAATADAVIRVRMRDSGTDSSGGYYSGVSFTNVTGGTGSSSVNNGSDWQISEVDSATAGNHTSAFVMDLQRPFSAIYTTMQFFGNSATNSGTLYTNYGGGVHAVSTAYDQINVIASAGNISGKIQVYGYNQ